MNSSIHLKYLSRSWLLVPLLLLMGCSPKGEGARNSFVKASGRPNEVLLVMDEDYLKGEEGTLIRRLLKTHIPSFPQVEEQMDVMTVGAKDFDSFLRYVRNILIVEIDKNRFTKNSVKYDYDTWASGQLVVTVTSPSRDSLSSLVNDRGRILLNLFVRHELYRQAENLTESHSSVVEELMVKNLGYHLYAPENIQSYKIGENCLWFSNDAIRKRMDLIVYRLPYYGKELTRDYLVHVRDSVLQANIPGSVEGSYMATSPYLQMTRQIQIPGQPLRYELRGLWELHGGGSMGGPFVSHAMITSGGKELLVVEAFVYHPNEAKRNLLQQVEASLFTFRASNDEAFDPKSVAETKWSAYQSYE